jgi:hypothetical protein
VLSSIQNLISSHSRCVILRRFFSAHYGPQTEGSPYVRHFQKFESKPPNLAGRRGGGMTARQGLKPSKYFLFNTDGENAQSNCLYIEICQSYRNEGCAQNIDGSQWWERGRSCDRTLRSMRSGWAVGSCLATPRLILCCQSVVQGLVCIPSRRPS